jgi:hypothetical protein
MPNTINRVSSATHVATFTLLCFAFASLLRANARAQETPSPIGEPPIVEITEPLAVIPPGREELLAQMLGRGETLPGECKFSNGQIEKETVIATYTCSSGAVAVALAHPGKATPGATITQQFAISVKSGTPAGGLVEALASRIRARENEFEWTWLEPTVKPRSTRLLVVIAVVAAVVLLIALGWRRRREKAL